jgi:hypothetical protein
VQFVVTMFGITAALPCGLSCFLAEIVVFCDMQDLAKRYSPEIKHHIDFAAGRRCWAVPSLVVWCFMW